MLSETGIKNLLLVSDATSKSNVQPLRFLTLDKRHSFNVSLVSRGHKTIVSHVSWFVAERKQMGVFRKV